MIRICAILLAFVATLAVAMPGRADVVPYACDGAALGPDDGPRICALFADALAVHSPGDTPVLADAAPLRLTVLALTDYSLHICLAKGGPCADRRLSVADRALSDPMITAFFQRLLKHPL